MKLQNSLFQIKESIGSLDSGKSYLLELDKDNIIFKAHFPERAVMPGVCIVEIARELLEDALGQGIRITKVNNVKFLSIIEPSVCDIIRYDFKKLEMPIEDGNGKVQIVVSSPETIFSKISFSFCLK